MASKLLELAGQQRTRVLVSALAQYAPKPATKSFVQRRLWFLTSRTSMRETDPIPTDERPEAPGEECVDWGVTSVNKYLPTSRVRSALSKLCIRSMSVA